MKKGDSRWCELVKDCWSDEDGFGIYVIELGHGAKDQMNPGHEPDLPALYVGSSFHSAERRMWTHFCGAPDLGSRKVKEHGLFLRYDLFKHMERYATREEAEAEEKAHARRLAEVGFRTHHDGVHTYFDRQIILKPIAPEVGSNALGGARHMRAVQDYVDQAIFSVVATMELRATASEARSVSGVAEALTTGRLNRSSDDLGLEAERRFAYSRKDLLEARIKELTHAGFLNDWPDGELSIARGRRKT